MRWISSLVIAFATYSRIPMPPVEWSEENRRYALCFFPLVGLAVGAGMAFWLWLCGLLGIQGFLRGAVAAALPILITGGIHMDGFMDTCDAMASWQPMEKRLEILKDSHIGAFAALGCGVYLLLSAGLYSECALRDAPALAACFLLSRAMSGYFSIALPPARPGGMLAGFSATAAGQTVKITCAVYFFAACLLIGRRAYFVLPAALGLAVYAKRFCMKYFGGITGDLAGWFLQINELLCVSAVVLGGKLL